MTTKKTFPIPLFVLAIASIALTFVLGNPQNAFAGGDGCFPPVPNEVRLTLPPGESSEVIPKTIDCQDPVISVEVVEEDCTEHGIDVSFDNTSIEQGIWSGEETITNTGVFSGTMDHCRVLFNVEDPGGGNTAFQEIWVTSREPQVGGEFLPIDNTALLLAGIQSSAIWMLPALAGIAGTATYILKTRMNKE